jgi:hypothetical protein
MNFTLLLVDLADLLINLAVSLVNFAFIADLVVLLVNLAVAIVNIAFTREFS